MADLLECLVQMSALRETVKRLEGLQRRFPPLRWRVRPLGGRPAVEEVALLAEAELFWGVRLRAVLTAERPLLPGFDPDVLIGRALLGEWPLPVALSRFCTRRAENLEVLERCSAADLGRCGRFPDGGVPSVADLVAIMLAADTEALGRIRDGLELAPNDATRGSRVSGPGDGERDDA